MTRTGSLWTTIDLPIVAKILGVLALLFSLTMALPLLVGLWQGETLVREETNTLLGFGAGLGIGLLVGAALLWLSRSSEGEFFRREGILTVAFVWLLVGALGALPFWLSGWFGGFWDCFFESVSGLTTTGSSILGAGDNEAIEQLPPSILFWRSWLHWLGGIGIVVMFLAFMPALGITEKALFQAEVAGVSKEGLRPRIRHSTLILTRIYLGITIGLFLAYWLLGMRVFDAVNHAFATIATGGFSTRNYSVGAFGSVAIEMVAVVGMLMAATNFGLYHRVLSLFKEAFRGRIFPNLKQLPRPREILRVFFGDPEFRFYFGTFVVVVGVLTLVLSFSGTDVADQGDGRAHEYADGVLHCVRDTSFQTASMISSTGFANSNLLSWPLLAQGIILVIMLMGGSSGSTGGGLKAARVLILFKLVGRSLRRFLRPRAVEPLRVGRETLDREKADGVVALAACWIMILAIGSVILLVLEPKLDLLGAFSSMVTSLCNMGPAFVAVSGDPSAYVTAAPDIGSYGSFGGFSWSGKAFMAFVMILGRLEIFTALIIIFPSFWKD